MNVSLLLASGALVDPALYDDIAIARALGPLSRFRINLLRQWASALCLDTKGDKMALVARIEIALDDGPAGECVG